MIGPGNPAEYSFRHLLLSLDYLQNQNERECTLINCIQCQCCKVILHTKYLISIFFIVRFYRIGGLPVAIVELLLATVEALGTISSNILGASFRKYSLKFGPLISLINKTRSRFMCLCFFLFRSLFMSSSNIIIFLFSNTQ